MRKASSKDRHDSRLVISGAGSPNALVLATLDTKQEVVSLLVHHLSARAINCAVVDTSARRPSRLKVPLPVARRLRALSGSLARRLLGRSRAEAVRKLATGLKGAAPDLISRFRPEVVVALGGTSGTAIVLPALAVLPPLLPKILLTTLDPGAGVNLASSLIVFRVPFDLESAHPLLDYVVSQVADVAASLARTPPPNPSSATLVAVSQLGVTTPCVKAAAKRLSSLGLTPVPFHMVGAGGLVMEQLLSEGTLHCCLDVTLSDITTALFGGLSFSNPQRLITAVRAEIPLVVVPGAVNSVIFGQPESVPTRYRSRKFLRPTEYVTVMRLNAEESSRIGRLIARCLADASREIHVLVPVLGFSASDKSDGEIATDLTGRRARGPWFDASANRAFLAGLRGELRSPLVEVAEFHYHINDRAFATLVADRLGALASQGSVRRRH